MKFMSRGFSLKEKLLLAALALILVALFYYQFVDKTVREAIVNAESDAQMYQTELTAAEKRLGELRQIQSNMDALEAEGKLTWMGSYNNEKAEVKFLNDILANTLQYSIKINPVTRKGNQIRRSFTLQYKTPNYASAQDITARLCQGENRCLVGDVKCSIDTSGIVTINESATFYETMIGGAPDAALPRDSAAAK